MVKPVKVRIDDMEFNVVGNDDVKYIQNIAKTLDEKIKKYKKTNYRLNQSQAIVLAAINILDESERNKMILQELKEGNPEQKKSVDSIKEINDLKSQITSFEEREKSYKAEIAKLKFDVETHTKEYMDKLDEITDLRNKKNKAEEREEELKKANAAQSERILELQKEIVDLSREVENLTGKDKL